MAYLLVCSLASLCRYKPFVTAPARTSKRFAVFIAAYREDAVILPTVHACLAQDYPDDRYDVVVISDHMQPETNAVLSSLPIKLLQVDFEKSTNTKSLQAALGYLDKAAYDIALVIDADNIIAPSYLSELNDTSRGQESEYRYGLSGCNQRGDKQFHIPFGTCQFGNVGGSDRFGDGL